jgi:HSP20 family molecular chaperone IbpA
MRKIDLLLTKHHVGVTPGARNLPGETQEIINETKYAEYNIGNFTRSFRISSEIEQDGIKAELKDGVMTLVLPKPEKAKPRKIRVS